MSDFPFLFNKPIMPAHELCLDVLRILQALEYEGWHEDDWLSFLEVAGVTVCERDEVKRALLVLWHIGPAWCVVFRDRWRLSPYSKTMTEEQVARQLVAWKSEVS